MGLLCTGPLREALTCTCSRGLCWAPSHSPAPQPGVVGVWLLSSHSSMSVSSPCGQREGGDGLYPSTGLSCECVALVESQDLRPRCGGRKALGRSTGVSPFVGAEAARALSWLEPFLFPFSRPHLASQRLSAPSKEEGRSGQQHCGAGVTWVVETGLAMHPTGATPDP